MSRRTWSAAEVARRIPGPDPSLLIHGPLDLAAENDPRVDAFRPDPDDARFAVRPRVGDVDVPIPRPIVVSSPKPDRDVVRAVHVLAERFAPYRDVPAAQIVFVYWVIRYTSRSCPVGPALTCGSASSNAISVKVPVMTALFLPGDCCRDASKRLGEIASAKEFRSGENRAR